MDPILVLGCQMAQIIGVVVDHQLGVRSHVRVPAAWSSHDAVRLSLARLVDIHSFGSSVSWNKLVDGRSLGGSEVLVEGKRVVFGFFVLVLPLLQICSSSHK